MKVMNEENQNFTDYVSRISDTTCSLDDGELTLFRADLVRISWSILVTSHI